MTLCSVQFFPWICTARVGDHRALDSRLIPHLVTLEVWMRYATALLLRLYLIQSSYVCSVKTFRKTSFLPTEQSSFWVLFSCSPHHRGRYRIKAYPTFLVSLVALSLFSKCWNISKWTLSSSIPSSSPISWSWSLLIAVCKSSSPWLSAAGSDKLQFSVRLRRSCRRWN